MPYSRERVPADQVADLDGVTVYNTYKDDDIEQGPRHYHFTTDEDCGDYGCDHIDSGFNHSFDARRLPGFKEAVEAKRPPFITGVAMSPSERGRSESLWSEYHRVEGSLIKGVIESAIKAGLITDKGIEIK